MTQEQIRLKLTFMRPRLTELLKEMEAEHDTRCLCKEGAKCTVDDAMAEEFLLLEKEYCRLGIQEVEASRIESQLTGEHRERYMEAGNRLEQLLKETIEMNNRMLAKSSKEPHVLM